MSGLTLIGLTPPLRLPAIPAVDHLLELADVAQRHPSDLSIQELFELGAGAAHLEAELQRVTEERDAARGRADDLEEKLEDALDASSLLRAEVSVLRRGLAEAAQPRLQASFERLTVTVTGESYAAVASRLTTAVKSEGAHLVEKLARRRRAHGFDLSDCDDSVVIDVEAAP